jgi:hypothetical protein
MKRDGAGWLVLSRVGVVGCRLFEEDQDEACCHGEFSHDLQKASIRMDGRMGWDGMGWRPARLRAIAWVAGGLVAWFLTSSSESCKRDRDTKTVMTSGVRAMAPHSERDVCQRRGNGSADWSQPHCPPQTYTPRSACWGITPHLRGAH